MAATKIGTVTALLVAKTGKFERGMKRARRSTGRFSKGLKAAKGAVAKFGLALSGALIARAFVRSIREASRAIDDLAKKSALLGLTTEKLAGLQFAAKLASVNVETFNMALQRMVRRVAEAAKGTGEAQGALRELGLDASVLASLSPDRQFRLIADAMETVATQGDRVRLSMKLFDSEGVKLALVMRGGAAALDAAEKEARAFGVAISEFDAQRIQDANDAWSRMTERLRGVSIAAAVANTTLKTALADTVDRVVGKWTEWLGIINRTRIRGTEMWQAMIEGGRQAQSQVDAINQRNRAAALEQAKAFNRLTDEAEKMADSFRSPMEVLEDKLGRANELLEAGAFSAQQYKQVLEGLGTEMANLGGVTEATAEKMMRVVSRGPSGARFGGAVGVGTTEARRATFAAQNIKSERFQKETSKNTKDTAAGVDETVRVLGDVERAIISRSIQLVSF